ncbi:hypothetical protein CN918_30240 [Priestia megaterium]|nr:hypothetical protein CN918_30240 [Priestia megaterium]
MKSELFEVKSGENKGVYLKVCNSIPREKQIELLGYNGLQGGFIDSVKVDFYKRHGAATNKTLQSIDTFKQVSTIWRLNSYGQNNKSTLEYKKEEIKKVQEELEKIDTEVKNR